MGLWPGTVKEPDRGAAACSDVAVTVGREPVMAFSDVFTCGSEGTSTDGLGPVTELTDGFGPAVASVFGPAVASSSGPGGDPEASTDVVPDVSAGVAAGVPSGRSSGVFSG